MGLGENWTTARRISSGALRSRIAMISTAMAPWHAVSARVIHASRRTMCELSGSSLTAGSGRKTSAVSSVSARHTLAGSYCASHGSTCCYIVPTWTSMRDPKYVTPL